MSLKVPPPPEPHPGAVEVYGHDLPRGRVDEIRERLRSSDADVLSTYQTYLGEFPGVEGKLQLRVGINKDGKVVRVAPVYSEVTTALSARIEPILSAIDFDPGPEAYVYYTLGFRPEPLEVLKVETDFAKSPAAVVVLVENRSAFRLPAVSATVTVLGPEKAKPLRIYRRRLDVAFAAGERHEIRIPLGAEWATARNSFLVTVGPASADKPAED